jgi:phage tail-like protein
MAFEDIKDFKFIAINTPFLWNQGEEIVELDQQGNILIDKDKKSIKINKEGILLNSSEEYLFVKNIELQFPFLSTINSNVDNIDIDGPCLDFVFDNCDILYILDKKGNKLYTFDLNSGYLEYVNCLVLNDIRFIQIGLKNIFLIDKNNTLRVLSKFNYQLVTHMDIVQELSIACISLDKFENLYVYDNNLNDIYQINYNTKKKESVLQKNEIIKQKLTKKISISNKEGSSNNNNDDSNKESNNNHVIDMFVKKDGSKFYLLLKDSLILIDPTKTDFERNIDLSEIKDFAPLNMAVDIEENVFISNMLADDTKSSVIKIDNKDDSISKLAYLGHCNKLLISKNAKDCLYSINIGNKNANNILSIVTKGIKSQSFLSEYQKKIGITIAKLQKFPRYLANAIYISPAIDSFTFGLQWHKFKIDYKIPENTFFNLSYYISDNENIFDNHNESISNINQDKIINNHNENTENNIDTKVLDSKTLERENKKINIVWSKPLLNPTDALFIENMKGRFLWFKLNLYSHDPSKSPLINSIKAYYPRKSYLRYLPAVYQENNKYQDLLVRFLSIFETFFMDLEENIASFKKYLDAQVTPQGFLPWLASWIALAYDEKWPIDKFRLLVERSPDLYKKRGTRKGIEEIILLYLDDNESDFGDTTISNNIVFDITKERENNKNSLQFQNNQIKVNQTLKVLIFENFHIDCVRENKEYARLFCNDPYSFCILLHPAIADRNKLETIQKIVEIEKPAHTKGSVRLLEPWFHLGMHTYLGINSQLNKQVFILGHSSLARDTILNTMDNRGQIDIRSRIGIDTTVS